LVLAGLDPTGRAGLLADAEAIVGAGARPVLCATAIAAQSEQRLLLTHPLPPEAILAQVEGALADGPVQAVKIGMVGSVSCVPIIAMLIDGPCSGIPVVVDPVLETSRGDTLFPGTPEELVPLLERAHLVTPNLREAEALGGLAVTDVALMYEAASRVLLLGSRAVLLKGGHLAGAPSDLLLQASGARWFRDGRIAGSRRGTGCRLSSAIAAGLACGRSLEESVARARAFVRGYLTDAAEGV
jgi:hydroxymethylpyrimidine/phosphomethylpyrimidine kinase